MSDTTQTATETLVRKTITITIDGKDYLVSTFRFGKAVRAFALITEIAAAAGLEDAVKRLLGEDTPAVSGDDEEAPAQPAQWTLSSLIGQLLVMLPRMMREGVPAVYKLLALIVTPNAELKEMERDERIDVEKVLYDKGFELAFDGELDEILGAFSAAAQVIGVETLAGNLSALVRMVINRK
jgi:hypothetical protein